MHRSGYYWHLADTDLFILCMVCASAMFNDLFKGKNS